MNKQYTEERKIFSFDRTISSKIIHSEPDRYKLLEDISFKSKNIIKEYNNYYWEQLKDGTIINKPMDRFNHAMDAIRYGVYSQYAKRADFFVI